MDAPPSWDGDELDQGYGGCPEKELPDPLQGERVEIRQKEKYSPDHSRNDDG
jgi:hypothetical protein